MKAVTLQRLSVCRCGFLLLKDEIPLGAPYEIDETQKDQFTFTCGGCGSVREITGVLACNKDGCGFLPEEIFQPAN